MLYLSFGQKQETCMHAELLKKIEFLLSIVIKKISVSVTKNTIFVQGSTRVLQDQDWAPLFKDTK